MQTSFVAGFRYKVDAAHAEAFEVTYGTQGVWAQLFAEEPGYLGTELWRATGEAGIYLVFDRWTAESRYESFLAANRERYDALGLKTERLYEEEKRLGHFEHLRAASYV